MAICLPSEAWSHEQWDELGHPIRHEHEAPRSPANTPDAGESEEGDDPDPSAETHDGFYFRFQFGRGSATSKQRRLLAAGPPRAMIVRRGFVTSLDFEVGGVLVENLVFYLRWGFAGSGRPTQTNDGDEVDVGNATLALSRVGAGAQYYFESTNIFVALTGCDVRFALLNEDGYSIDGFSRPTQGKMVFIAVGKEWWVSDNWGLGVVLQGGAGEIPVGRNIYSGPTQLRDVSLAFSATYN